MASDLYSDLDGEALLAYLAELAELADLLPDEPHDEHLGDWLNSIIS